MGGSAAVMYKLQLNLSEFYFTWRCRTPFSSESPWCRVQWRRKGRASDRPSWGCSRFLLGPLRCVAGKHDDTAFKEESCRQHSHVRARL